jgi:transcriptional regulator with XRE-family HTH domain
VNNPGQSLRQARERAGLSLAEISLRTKVREALLEAIEREEFEQLPAGLLTRGFLRAYAREVDLDPEAVVDQYRRRYESDTLSPVPARPPAHFASRQTTERRMAQVRVAMIVLTAVVVILIVYSGDHAETPEAIVSEPVSAGGDDKGLPLDRPREALASEDPTHAVDVGRVGGLVLEIRPTGPVWVEATADSHRVMYQLLRPGERRRLEALDELVVRIGDAGVFQYTINGERGRALGGPTAVRDIRITRDNFTTFLDQ